MEAVTTEPRLDNTVNTVASVAAAGERALTPATAANFEAVAFELGLWLSGLDSFLNARGGSVVDAVRAGAATRDWTKEFRLAQQALLLCSKLNFQLGKSLREASDQRAAPNFRGGDAHNSVFGAANEREITPQDVYALSLALKDAILLGESLLRAAPLRFGEWTAWSNFLSERLKANEVFGKLIERAEKTGEAFLPEALNALVRRLPAEHGDLDGVFRHFAKTLKWLSVIGAMLERDEPLKLTLLIFARVYEQIQEMIAHVNNRLVRFPGEETELFAALDGAAYTASLELKKVYGQELSNLAGIRAAPSVYARIETAYALLNDSFQQTLVGFARLLDRDVDPLQIFPNFYVKFEQSMILRQDLWRVLQTVQTAERAPEREQIARLREHLTAFLGSSLHFLFYKDKETLERFVEEILVTDNKKDLVPILHRFGAYLETLFGQVNMRTVLANHPFQV